MSDLAILGASGHGKVVADAALAAGWTSVTFYDAKAAAGSACGPWRVAGTEADLVRDQARFGGFVVGIGDNATRLARTRDLAARGLAPAVIVHPGAVVSPHAEVGPGSVVFARAVVNPFARLGSACIINTGATIDHDCVLSDGVHVSPGAHLAGTVRVGEGSWIGIGASVIQGLVIGARAVVGAGAAVIEDVADGVTVVGVPARPIVRG